jgi:hypothetical protein
LARKNQARVIKAMEILSDTICLLAGTVLLALIAFPERFIPETVSRIKKVGATYWGCYPGENTDETKEEKTIEVKVVKTKERVVGGSTRYEMGRGISFRGN